MILGHDFDTSDGGVGEHDLCPIVRRFSNDITGDQRHEAIAVVLVARGIEGNGTESSGLGSVGGAVCKHNIRTKLELVGCVVRRRAAGNNSSRAESGGDSGGVWESIEGQGAIGDEAVNELAGKAVIRKAVGGRSDGFLDRSDGFLDRADGSLHDMDVFICGANVEMDGAREESEAISEMDVVESVMETGKFVVGVDSVDGKTTSGIKKDLFMDGSEDGSLRAILRGNAAAKTDVFGDKMEKGVPLDKEEVSAQGDGAVVLFNERGQGRGNEGGSVLDAWVDAEFACP